MYISVNSYTVVWDKNDDMNVCKVNINLKKKIIFNYLMTVKLYHK